MSTLKGSDDCTDIVLDFIAGGVPGNPSGESSGNYNAVIGDANASDDLSQYSLADIIGTVMEDALSRGMPSTATGRYQIIKKTLENLISELHLDMRTMFTPDLQDKLAVQLLVGRGYSHWWRGEITATTFAHNISCEWASLPDPRNGGRSHYDGDSAGNHASCSLTSVLAMLATARHHIPPPAPPVGTAAA